MSDGIEGTEKTPKHISTPHIILKLHVKAFKPFRPPHMTKGTHMKALKVKTASIKSTIPRDVLLQSESTRLIKATVPSALKSTPAAVRNRAIASQSVAAIDAANYGTV